MIWVGAALLLPKGLPAGVMLAGFVQGGLMALTAVALVIVYRSSRIINFAQAEIGGVAAMLAIVLVVRRGVSYAIAMPLGLVVAIATGALIEIMVVRRFFRAPRLILTVATIGVAQVLAAASLALPQLIESSDPGGRLEGFGAPWNIRFSLGPTTFDFDSVLVIVVVPVVLLALGWFLSRTDNGIAARAAADSQDRALLLGIPVRRLSILTWMIAGGLSGLTAVLNAGVLGLGANPSMSGLSGPETLMVPLAAAVIGRFERLPSAIVASFGLSIFAEAIYWNYPRATTVDVVVFAVILAALLLQRQAASRVSGEDLGSFVAVQEMRTVPRQIAQLPEVRVAKRVFAIFLAAVAVGWPILVSNSQVIFFSFTAIFAIIGLSLVILTGWAGQLTLGQFAFVGIGAATTGALVNSAQLDLVFALLLSAGAGALVALVIGAPALRIPGLFLAPLTLAFAVAMSSFVLNTNYFPTLNPLQIERPFLLDRFDLNSPRTFYYLCLACLGIAIWITRNFRQSRLGRAVVGVRDNERMAAMFSLAPVRMKLTAFALSGGLAGLAGGLYALQVFGVPINGFGAILSMQVFSMVVVGGLVSITGGVVGAVYVYAAQYFISGALQLFVTGTGILVVLLIFPGGIAALLYSIRDRALRWLADRHGLDTSRGRPTSDSTHTEELSTFELLRARASGSSSESSDLAVPRPIRCRPWVASSFARWPLQRQSAYVRRIAAVATLVMASSGLVSLWSGAPTAVLGVVAVVVGASSFLLWAALGTASGQDAFGAWAQTIREFVAGAEAEMATSRRAWRPSLADSAVVAVVAAGLGALLGVPMFGTVGGSIAAACVAAFVVLADWWWSVRAGSPARMLAMVEKKGVIASNSAANSLGRESADGCDILLRFSSIDAHYDHLQVLFGVDADVEENAAVALLGTNGAGKSTLLKVAAGLLAASGGKVMFDGEDITDMGPIDRVQRGIVVVPAKAIFGSLTVRENLRLAGWLARHTGRTAELEADMERVFEMFPVLRQRLGQRASLLSGGEQQMLALSQGILCHPRVLLVDELSLGLAPILVAEIMKAIRELQSEGVTIVVVEQSLNLSTVMASRAWFLEKGEIRFRGTPAELGESDLLRAVLLKSGDDASHAGAGSNGKVPRLQVSPRGRRQRPLRAEGPERAVVLTAHGLTKRFGGVTAVDDFHLEVRRGQIAGIIGANGAGKTTVFDLMSGLLTPDEGTLTLYGRDISRASPAARAAMGLGRTFQDVRMMPSLTAREAVAVSMERHVDVREPVALLTRVPGASRSEQKVLAAADELLEAFGLGHYATTFVADLSTGTRRVLELACSAGHSPSVLLLDEPTSGLAHRETEAMAERLLDFRKNTGATLVLIEHDVPLVATLSDAITCMHLGTVLATGSPNEVLNHPEVVSAYLGEDEAAIGRSNHGAATSLPVPAKVNG